MSALRTLGTFGAALGLTFTTLTAASETSLASVLICQQPQESGSGEIEKEVRAFIAHYIKTLEDKNEKAVLELFVADGRFAWFTDGAKSYSTPQDVLAGMQRYAGVTFKTTLSDVRVVPLNGTLASVRSAFRTKLSVPGSDDFEYGGVITWVVEKAQTTGKWRVLQGHTSTPGGPPKSGQRDTKPEGKQEDTARAAEQKDTPHSGVEREVETFVAHYIKTLEGKDEKAVRELFVADERFAWFTDGVRSYSAPADVTAGMQRYAGITFKTTLSGVRVVPLGATLASARSRFRTKLTIPDSDDYEYGGVITLIVEKAQKTGTWRVLQGHTSTPGGLSNEDDRQKKSGGTR